MIGSGRGQHHEVWVVLVKGLVDGSGREGGVDCLDRHMDDARVGHVEAKAPQEAVLHQEAVRLRSTNDNMIASQISSEKGEKERGRERDRETETEREREREREREKREREREKRERERERE